jgi:hypothetical protein
VRADRAFDDQELIVGTAPGHPRPIRQTPPNTVLDRNSSSSQRRTGDSGLSLAATRLFALVCARSV